MFLGSKDFYWLKMEVGKKTKEDDLLSISHIISLEKCI
jgi:hypothetical protein